MIGRKASLAMANLFVGMVLGLVAQKLIAVYFGKDPLGQVTFALGALGLVFFITDMGMGQAHVKRVSEGRHAGDCFATFAVYKIASTLLFVVLVLGGFWFYATYVGLVEDVSIPVVVAILVYYVAKSVQEVGQSSFEARLEMARLQATAFADTAVRVGLSILAAFLAGVYLHQSGPLQGLVDPDTAFGQWFRDNPAVPLALATTAGGLAAATLALVMFARVREPGRFRWDLLKDYALFALPLFVGTAVTSIVANIDSFLLGLFLSASEVGVFGAVRRIVFVIASVAPPLGALLFPTFSAMLAGGDSSNVSRYMDQSIRFLSMLTLPIVAFTAVFADDVIRLALTDEFLTGTLTMGFLAFYVYVNMVAAPYANLIMGSGRPGVLVRIGATTAILVIVLDVLLVPYDIRSLGIRLPGLGMEGAALGTLLAGILYLALVRTAAYRITRYRQRTSLWKHAVAAGVMVLALVVLDQEVMPLVHWYHFILYTVLGALVNLAALIALREFTRKDWALVRESVHPVEMLRYVRDELRGKRD